MLHKVLFALAFILVFTATVYAGGGKERQTVVVQKIKDMDSFAIQSDPEWVNKTTQEFPDGIRIDDEFIVEYYCAEKNAVGTIYTPGKCN